ncbi:MAG: hypothetical protein RIG88_07915 [Roseitalea porphyridii]
MLSWMQQHPERLHAILAEEAVGASPEELTPVGDPSIRAHLRFVAEALDAHAGPGARESARRFTADLPGRLRDPDALQRQLTLVGEAHAFETARQFGDDAGEDPTNRVVVERRVRLGAWLRVFLDELDSTGMWASPVAEIANGWMAENQTRLADTIFAMDRAAKLAARERGGEDAIASAEAVNVLGQAASVQAHVRFLVEAITQA